MQESSDASPKVYHQLDLFWGEVVIWGMHHGLGGSQNGILGFSLFIVSTNPFEINNLILGHCSQNHHHMWPRYIIPKDLYLVGGFWPTPKSPVWKFHLAHQATICCGKTLATSSVRYLPLSSKVWWNAAMEHLNSSAASDIWIEQKIRNGAPEPKKSGMVRKGGSECNNHHHNLQVAWAIWWPLLEQLRQLGLLSLHQLQGDRGTFHLVHPVHPGQANDPVVECYDAVSIVSGLDMAWTSDEAQCAPHSPMRSSVGDDMLWHRIWCQKTFRAPVSPCRTEQDRPEGVQEGRWWCRRNSIWQVISFGSIQPKIISLII